MFPFGGVSKPVVGLDIGATAIKAVELHRSGRRWSVHRVGWKPLPPKVVSGGKVKDKEAMVQALRELWSDARFGCKRVAIAVGGPAVIIKRIQVPLMSELDLEDQIALEAEEHIPFDIEEVYLDFQILERGAEQMEVLLTACKKEVVDNRMEAPREAGLEPVACDMDLFCLANAFDAFCRPALAAKGEKSDKIPATTLINVGASHLSVAILVNGLPEFTREHAFGTERLLQELQQNQGRSYEDAERMIRLGRDSRDVPWPGEEREAALNSFLEQMAGLIRQTVDFHHAGHPNQRVGTVFVAGGCAAIPELPGTLQSVINLPVVRLDPLSGLAGTTPAPLNSGNAPAFLVALGLALRGDAP
ncbi:MAG: type IV pilus assembly protein PilM [Magnetococcales bacterium]|nr:type IV pilus assembly protein PilM [Magnetococcales bacterium]